MADYLNSVQTADTYPVVQGSGTVAPGAACFPPDVYTEQIVFDVGNQPVYLRTFQYTNEGRDYVLEDREQLVTAGLGYVLTNVAGCMWRSAIPGTPAVIIAKRYLVADQRLSPGLAFTGSVAASGGLTPPSTVPQVQFQLTGVPISTSGVADFDNTLGVVQFAIVDDPGNARTKISAQVPVGPVRIFDSLLAAPAASFSVSTIAALLTAAYGSTAAPPALHNLWIDLYGASSGAVNEAQVLMTLNGDAGAHYDVESQYIAGTTVTNVVNAATQTAASVGVVPGTSAPAGSSGANHFRIPNYDNGTLFKMILGTYADHSNSLATGFHSGASANQWLSTAAVTSLLISLNTGNFVAGSRCTVYAF